MLAVHCFRLWCGRLACTENVQTQAAGYIASLPMFIENAHRSRLDSFTVYGLPEMMDALQRHVFTDVIWPDFVKIAMGGKPLVRLQPIKPGEPFQVAGLTVSIRVDHIVPTCGFIVTDQRSSIIFGSDLSSEIAQPSNLR